MKTNELLQSFFLSDTPDSRVPLDEELDTLYTKTPPTFNYSNNSFYHLRKNTRIPEVCILGRSNVGKSTLLNAVARRQTSELARTSKKAGKTRTMNVYGFGPPRRLPPELLGPEYKGKEAMPDHTFYLVDMPGYGAGSLDIWGKNITLYLTKRSACKGAILLIDARAGPKENDWQAIQILGAANVPTAFIITKADNVKSLDELRATVEKLHEGIRRIELRLPDGNTWSWHKEVYVTAVGSQSPKIVSATVAMARLAVARLAGLIGDRRPKEEKNRKWGGKVVSFEELMRTPREPVPRSTDAPQGVSGAVKQKRENKIMSPKAFEELMRTPNEYVTKKQRSSGAADHSGSRSQSKSSGGKMNHVAGAERSPNHQNDMRGPNRPKTKSPASHLLAARPSSGRSQTRWFRASRTMTNDSPASGPPPVGSQELKRLLDEFWADLKASEGRPRDHARMNMRKLESRIPKPRKDREAQIWNRDRRKYPEETKRVEMVKRNRVVREESRILLQARKERQKLLDDMMKQEYKDYAARFGMFPTFPDPFADADAEEDADEDDDLSYEEDIRASRLAARKKSGGFKKGSGSKGRKASKPTKDNDELDSFEAQFAKAKDSADDDDDDDRGNKSSF